LNGQRYYQEGIAMTYSEGHQNSLIRQDIMIPGAEKHLQLIGPGAEWAYTKVTTHEFSTVRPHPMGPQGSPLPRDKTGEMDDEAIDDENVNVEDVNEDEDEASTRKGTAQPDNTDDTTAKDADADQASTRKGNFQPDPEDSPI
jgi:hypothetical protein